MIEFARLTGSQQVQCPQFHHNGTRSVSTATEYTLTGLEEYSVYTISNFSLTWGVFISIYNSLQ